MLLHLHYLCPSVCSKVKISETIIKAVCVRTPESESESRIASAVRRRARNSGTTRSGNRWCVRALRDGVAEGKTSQNPERITPTCTAPLPAPASIPPCKRKRGAGDCETRVAKCVAAFASRCRGSSLNWWSVENETLLPVRHSARTQLLLLHSSVKHGFWGGYFLMNLT